MAGEEQPNSDHDPVVAEAENEQIDAAPEQEQAASHESRNQWILFGILAGIMLVVVLVVAVIRPLIFDRIIPAVMGDFLTPTPVVVEAEVTPVKGQTDVESAPTEAATEAGENEEIFIPAASSDTGGESESESSESEPVVEETAVPPEPTPEPSTHTVQIGDNLTKISQQYGVSVQEIMAANGLTNADLISVGQVLIIPNN
jgi:LysM repeat protein